MVNWVTMFSVMALAGGGMGFFVFPMGLKWGLRTFVNLKENGLVFPIYKAPPFKSKSQYYIYELKNPKEVLLGQKMKFQLKGPYVYWAILYRDNVVFRDSEQLVGFHSHRKLFLDEEASVNLDEEIWIVNPIVIGIQSSVKSIVIDKVPFKSVSEPIVFNAVNVMMDQYKLRLVSKTTPRDLLQGTKIELLQLLTDLATRFGLASFLPPGPPENTFGLSHAQNHTIDIQEIFTGVGNADNFARVNTWRGMSKVEYFRGKCSIINGTNGELYQPFIENGKSIKVFLGQLCRTFHMDPVTDGPVEIEHGLMAIEFEISQRLYMGARSNPNNKCFCKDTRTYDCQYDGLISMGPCFFDAPLYFARPNFQGVSRQIRSLVDDDTVEYPQIPLKQSFWLDPITGTIMKLNLSLTGVFKVVRQRYMRDMNNIRNLTYAPLFVANESVVIPAEVGILLYILQTFVEYHKIIMLLIAILGGSVLVMRRLRSRKTTSPLPKPAIEPPQTSQPPQLPQPPPQTSTSEREVEGQ